MNRKWIVAAGLIVLTAGLSRTAPAADEKGFQPLFNGKDLSGWVTPADKDLFKVEDGAILGQTQGNLKKNEFLVTEKKYKDFDLKAKVKLGNHNSGIQFRSKRADDGAVSGPQADVADGYWGLLYEERGRGFLDQGSIEKAKKLLKKDDWNEYEIVAKGDHVTIYFNGEKIIDREDSAMAKDGIIALQVHVGPPMKVWFKDMMIKPLD